MAYLDHAASTQVRPEVVDLVAAELSWVGNSSSIHAHGRHAKKAIEVAREQVASAFGTAPAEVVFTAGGTEADNHAIKGIFEARNREANRPILVTTAIEHPAVRDSVEWLVSRGAHRLLLPITSAGVVDVAAAEELLRANVDAVALVSVMWANNELGTIQPIAALAELCNELEIPLHSDAVQAAAFEALDFDRHGLASIAVSGHKLGAPQGIGAMLLKRNITIEPLLHGGGQERRTRSGTVPAALIAGLGLAAQIEAEERVATAARVAALRDELQRVLLAQVPGVVINAIDSPRLPSIVSATLPGVDAQALLLALDAAGVCVSAGSACSAGTPKPSQVLAAIGLDAAAMAGTVRLSVGWSSTMADIAKFAEVLQPALARSPLTV